MKTLIIRISMILIGITLLNAYGDDVAKSPQAAPSQPTGVPAHATEPASHPPVPIRFHLDEPRTVTLVIEDAEGQRIRNLISAQSFPAGDQTVWWDGMREDGVEEIHVPGIARFNRQRYAVAQPGSYRVRGLSRGVLAGEGTGELAGLDVELE